MDLDVTCVRCDVADTSRVRTQKRSHGFLYVLYFVLFFLRPFSKRQNRGEAQENVSLKLVYMDYVSKTATI